jgi:hypothetical protein
MTPKMFKENIGVIYFFEISRKVVSPKAQTINDMQMVKSTPQALFLLLRPNLPPID